MYRFFVIIFIILFSVTAYAQEGGRHAVMLHTDVMSYNKGYRDRSFVDKSYASFPVFMYSIGAEWRTIDKTGISFGIGFSGTTTGSGSKFNYDQFEYQPVTNISIPYSFMGKSWHSFGIELGVSWFLYFARSADVTYYAPDGSLLLKEKGAVELQRKESFVFVNFLLRFLPEDFIHFKIRLGREDFIVTDSLFNIGAIFPVDRYCFEFRASLATPYSLLSKNEVLKSNQRLFFFAGRKFDAVKVVLNLGVLLNNGHGGNGNIGIFERMSTGVAFVLAW